MQNCPVREVERMQRILAAQQRELDRRANTISTLADRLAETQRELDDAMRVGAGWALVARLEAEAVRV
jgi:hypothetical protein